jgi:hypothetical protein
MIAGCLEGLSFLYFLMVFKEKSETFIIPGQYRYVGHIYLLWNRVESECCAFCFSYQEINYNIIVNIAWAIWCPGGQKKWIHKNKDIRWQLHLERM